MLVSAVHNFAICDRLPVFYRFSQTQTRVFRDKMETVKIMKGIVNTILVIKTEQLNLGTILYCSFHYTCTYSQKHDMVAIHCVGSVHQTQ